MNEHSLEHFDEERESILTLPIRKKDLGQFVIDLLGQQQTIERIYEEPFDFDLNWFINLHELINQRINQQNHSTLVSFSFIVYFESGLKRSITSIEALQGYNETKKDIPCGVKIIWNYLVQFPAKNHPEKQVISFSAFRQKNKKIELDGISPIGIISRIYSSKSERRIISVQIDHTERTWGDDLEVIISNHIDEGLRKNSWNLFYDIVRSVTTLSMLIGGFIFGFYSSITLKMDQIKSEITKYADLNKNIEIGQELLDKKLDIIVKILEVSSTKDEGVGLMMIYMFLASFISILFFEITKKQSHSFFVLSKPSEDYKSLKMKKEQMKIYIVAISSISTILLNIISSFGYDYLK